MISVSSTLHSSINRSAIQCLYISLLIFATIAHDVTFKLAYFTLPLASLCFPILFLLAGLLAGTMVVRSCVAFLMGCSVVNFIIVGMISQQSNWLINDFWVNNFQSETEIYSLLLIGFHVSILTCIMLVYAWKWWRGRVNFIVIALSAFIANLVDLGFMWPTLWSYGDDHYIASWKLLTIITFKMNILVLCLPIGWLAIRQKIS